MKPFISRLKHGLAGATVLYLVSTMAGADLLGVQPDFPKMSFGGDGSAVIDQSADPNFDVSATTIDLLLTSSSGPATAFIDPTTIIQLNVDSVCDWISGAAGDDVSVSGTFYDSGFNLIKDGVVLTGEIVETGNAMATDTTATFDFRASVTGGLLLNDGDWPLDAGVPVEAGIQLTLEGTNVPFVTNNCNTYLTSINVSGIIGPDASEPPGGIDPTNPGTGTQGYWRNHPEAWVDYYGNPIDEITVGGTTYTKAEAISHMDSKPKGDRTINLFRQLVAAMLNVAINNDDACIAAEIDAANDWLAINTLGSGIGAKDAAWTVEIDAAHEKLDEYNNGQLCAPHRDDL
jgi:hypothetical protein